MCKKLAFIVSTAFLMLLNSYRVQAQKAFEQGWIVGTAGLPLESDATPVTVAIAPVMKIWISILLLVSSMALAQSGEPFKKGNTVYVESLSKNENSQETLKAFVDQLQEWGHWKVVSNKSSADLIIKLKLEASKGITATSWGGTSMACSARFYDKTDALLWESDTYKASPNGTNGFNAKKAAVRKLVNAIEKKYR